jgi:hypothetical protein
MMAEHQLSQSMFFGNLNAFGRTLVLSPSTNKVGRMLVLSPSPYKKTGSRTQGTEDAVVSPNVHKDLRFPQHAFPANPMRLQDT